MATTRVNFRLANELVERTDLAADVTGDTRTGIVTAALRAYLESLESDSGFEAALVDRYLEGNLDDTALHHVLDPRDAAAVRASAALLERTDDLATALADTRESS